jgi:glycosyltransferase involved in cell wall biosynthesis
VRTTLSEHRIVLSTVLLNWNRADLLARTLESYLATVSVPYELIIIDNGSTDESPHHIRAACEGRANHQAVLLPDNLGGEAINIGIERCRGRYVHVSENDMEYLPGWDRTLLAKLRAFPGIGQISPFSPFYQGEDGELVRWEGASPRTKDAMTVYVVNNITTTCVAPREVYDSGVRWGARSGKFRFPKDGRFSKAVNALGYFVAMNDTSVVRNLGHDIEEFKNRLPYYIENYAAKPRMGLEGFDRRLRAAGHRLARDKDGRWSIEELGDDPETFEGKG